MGNIDCEIYISQLVTFFENNPNDLMTLIGDVQKKQFFDKLREQCEKNSKNGGDHIISRDQMIEIVLSLKIPEITEESVESYIQITKWGDINLN
jgi:hypothetical protein